MILQGVIPSITGTQELTRDDALALFEKAASNGSDFAQHRVAMLHMPDMEMALLWYKKAALQNYAPSQFNISLLLCHSNREIPSAMYWLKKAAESGIREAWIMLQQKKLQIAEKCASCLEGLDGKGKHCTGCNAVYYCNKDCQIKHWNVNHKKECMDAKNCVKIMLMKEN